MVEQTYSVHTKCLALWLVNFCRIDIIVFCRIRKLTWKRPLKMDREVYGRVCGIVHNDSTDSLYSGIPIIF